MHDRDDPARSARRVAKCNPSVGLGLQRHQRVVFGEVLLKPLAQEIAALRDGQSARRAMQRVAEVLEVLAEGVVRQRPGMLGIAQVGNQDVVDSQRLGDRLAEQVEKGLLSRAEEAFGEGAKRGFEALQHPVLRRSESDFELLVTALEPENRFLGGLKFAAEAEKLVGLRFRDQFSVDHASLA
ncbi:hypothetical protein D3C87_739380 [compost metagenome]